MGSIIEPIHVAIDVAWTFFVLIRDIVNVAAWCFIGLCCCWGHAFKSQGLLKTREPVEDNVSPSTYVHVSLSMYMRSVDI